MNDHLNLKLIQKFIEAGCSSGNFIDQYRDKDSNLEEYTSNFHSEWTKLCKACFNKFTICFYHRWHCLIFIPNQMWCELWNIQSFHHVRTAHRNNSDFLEKHILSTYCETHTHERLVHRYNQSSCIVTTSKLIIYIEGERNTHIENNRIVAVCSDNDTLWTRNKGFAVYVNIETNIE